MKLFKTVIPIMGLWLATGPALAAAGSEGYPHHMHWAGGGWGMGIFGPILMIAFLGLTVVLVVLAVRWVSGGEILAGGAQKPPAGRAPLDILKERLAKGEIDPQEFEDRRSALGD